MKKRRDPSLFDDRPRVAEFFAGIGLMRLGLEEAGWRVVWANDIAESKRRMYCSHFGQDHVLDPRDVRDIRGCDIPDVELATASFPCTDLSVAGRRAGLAGEFSGLFWQFARVLREMGSARRPRIVLLENVLGFLKLRHGADLRECLEELSELNRLGYFVDVFTLDARHFVPQSRPRLFIVGDREASGSLDVDRVADGPPDELRPARLREFIGGLRRLRWSFSDLGELPVRGNSVTDMLDVLPDNDPHWWSPHRVSHLFGQMSPRSRRWVAEHEPRQTWRFATAFRRMRNGNSTAELRDDGLAGCLRTPKGGSARQILVRVGRGSRAARLLSPRECARLMGATKYKIPPNISDNQALFGFGDAVCVPAVTWLALHHAAFAGVSRAQETHPLRPCTSHTISVT